MGKGITVDDLRKYACWPEADTMLKAGRSSLAVATFLRGRGVMPEVHEYALSAVLTVYQRTLEQQPEEVEPKAQDDSFDELEEVRQLYGIQKARILSSRKLEATMQGALNKTLGNEFRIASELLRLSNTIRAERTKKRGTVNVKRPDTEKVRKRYGERVAKVISDPKSRNRVMAALNSVLERASEDPKSIAPKEPVKEPVQTVKAGK